MARTIEELKKAVEGIDGIRFINNEFVIDAQEDISISAHTVNLDKIIDFEIQPGEIWLQTGKTTIKYFYNDGAGWQVGYPSIRTIPHF